MVKSKKKKCNLNLSMSSKIFHIGYIHQLYIVAGQRRADLQEQAIKNNLLMLFCGPWLFVTLRVLKIIEIKGVRAATKKVFFC